MLGTPFYNRLLRKYVVAFGTLFNNITLVRFASDGVTEKDRIKVPIAYAPKEKYISPLEQDPDLTRNVQVILPRMAFEMVGLSYDPMRKQETNLKRKFVTPGYSNRITSSYVDTPYDINFELSIMVRNIEDGNQIVEQILPYFAPAYSMSINLNSAFPNEFRTIPITLNSVNQSIDYEGNYETTRSIIWTLSFTMKAWFSGPSLTQNTINTVITNIINDAYNYVSGDTNHVTVNLSGVGNTHFRYGDLVYQGPNAADATAVGQVVDWNTTTDRLTIKVLGGAYKANVRIWAADSNGSANISSFYVNPTQSVRIVVTPNPIDALPNSDYGYTTTITEY
jgi:hypothetical protein